MTMAIATASITIPVFTEYNGKRIEIGKIELPITFSPE